MIDLHVVINQDTINSVILGGVYVLALVAVVWILGHVMNFEATHPVAFWGVALCGLVPLWFLFDGTWVAGVLGVCSIAALGCMINSAGHRKKA